MEPYKWGGAQIAHVAELLKKQGATPADVANEADGLERIAARLRRPDAVPFPNPAFDNEDMAAMAERRARKLREVLALWASEQ